MHTLKILNIFVRPLNESRLPYMVTGAVAAILYGEPRLTLDIDIVINISKEDIKLLQEAFPEDRYYRPPEDVLYIEVSRQQRGHFNVIHHESGYRADIYLMGNDPLHYWGMKYSREIEVGEEIIQVAPPEYVIIRKLQYFKEGGSPKHLSDIRSMLNISREQIDIKQVERFIEQYQLQEVWKRIY